MKPPPDTYYTKFVKQHTDSWGNPTKKKPGDTGTQVGRGGVWWDMSGKNKPKGTRDWASKAK